ncbi:hypothetical protein ACJIZ3_005493 [Penstemon smallii]|uniref:Coenzyme Q-binding protein COQ10 START domain-containing protein n=1 Tax=Penstemon smallii TaxID=265156 RepID=A0ABD3S526_9LAMI
MASTMPATLLCSLSKFSTAKQFSNRRSPNLVKLLDAASAFVQHNTPLVVCFTGVVARAYEGGDSSNTLEIDDENDGGNGEDIEQDAYELQLDSESQDDEIEIEIENTGKNSRRIRSKVVVQASLEKLWDILTDYERLADFIPGLAVSQLVEKRDKFARLFQIGEQNLAFGLKFNAKGTIDCFEKDLQTLPFGRKRDIEFNMVEGDFQLFKGKWSLAQILNSSGNEVQYWRFRERFKCWTNNTCVCC